MHIVSDILGDVKFKPLAKTNFVIKVEAITENIGFTIHVKILGFTVLRLRSLVTLSVAFISSVKYTVIM